MTECIKFIDKNILYKNKYFFETWLPKKDETVKTTSLIKCDDFKVNLRLMV